MKMNVSKSKTVILASKDKAYTCHWWDKIRNKYLGTIIKRNGNLYQEIEDNIGKVGLIFKSLSMPLSNNSEVPKKAR